MGYLYFSAWIILLNIVASSSICFVVNDKILSILWLKSIQLCIPNSLSIHQLMGTYVDLISWLLTSAAINMGVQMSLQHTDFISFGYIWISGSYGSSTFFYHTTYVSTARWRLCAKNTCDSLPEGFYYVPNMTLGKQSISRE